MFAGVDFFETEVEPKAARSFKGWHSVGVSVTHLPSGLKNSLPCATALAGSRSKCVPWTSGFISSSHRHTASHRSRKEASLATMKKNGWTNIPNTTTFLYLSFMVYSWWLDITLQFAGYLSFIKNFELGPKASTLTEVESSRGTCNLGFGGLAAHGHSPLA